MEEEPAVEQEPVAEEPAVEETRPSEPVEEPAPVEAEPACGCGIACGEAPEPVEETQVSEPAEEQPVAEEPSAESAEENVEAPVPTAEAEEAEAERMLEDASKGEQAEPSEADPSESGVRTSDVHVDGRDDPADMPMTDEEHEELVQGDSNSGPERADPGEAPFYPSKDLPWEEVVRADPDAPEVSEIEPESPYGARAVLVAGEKKQLPRLPFFGCDHVSAEDYAAILEEIAKEDS